MAARVKDINLYRVMTSRRTAAINRRPLLIGTAAIVLLGALIAAGVIWFSLSMAELRAERDDLDRYVNSAQTQQRYNESLSLQQEAATAEQRANMVKQVLLNLSSYPDISAADYRRIQSYAGSAVVLSDMHYDHRSATLSLTATASDITSVPLFIKQLRESDSFANIQYSGYTQSTRLTNGTNGESTEVSEYRYELTFQLKAPRAALPKLDSDVAVQHDAGDAGSDTVDSTDGGGEGDSSADEPAIDATSPDAGQEG